MKKLKIIVLICSLFICASLNAMDVNLSDENSNQYTDDILGKGLLLDKTISYNGHRFFKSFHSKWVLPKGILSHIITAYEKPTANGSIIWIVWNYKKVYKVKIAFREDFDKKAEQAVLIVSNIMEQSKGLDFAYSEDLAPDEFL